MATVPYRTVPYLCVDREGSTVQNGKDKTTVVCERRRQQLNIVFLQCTCSYMQHSSNDQHLGKFVLLSRCAPLIIVIHLCVSIVVFSPKKTCSYCMLCVVWSEDYWICKNLASLLHDFLCMRLCITAGWYERRRKVRNYYNIFLCFHSIECYYHLFCLYM